MPDATLYDARTGDSLRAAVAVEYAGLQLEA